MAVDQQRYLDLIARAAFRAEYFCGHIQDMSAAQRAMTFVGAPTWGRINGWPCLKQNAAGEGTATTLAVAQVVDCTAPFSIEVLFSGLVAGSDFLFRQVNLGGWALHWEAAAFRMRLDAYDNAGAGARTLVTPNNGIPAQAPAHVVIAANAGVLTGSAWSKGVPVVASPVFAGVVANIAGPTACQVGGFNAGLIETMIVRVYPFALGNEDAACLAEQAKLMVGGW